MKDTLLQAIVLAATAFTGLLCGASLDQSFKQLPARRRIGVKTFSTYAKAADLKNGVVWYAVLGIGSALTSLAAAVLAFAGHSKDHYALFLYLGGFFSICHTVCTTQAAPTYHKQKEIDGEEKLEKLFNKFEKIQTLRSIFIVLNFISFLWALAVVL